MSGHRLILIHGGIVQHDVSDAGLVGQTDGRIPFRLVVLPHMVVQRIPTGVDVFADDIAELEVLLVHHTVRSVDDAHLDGVELAADMAGDELELAPEVIIQLCQHGLAHELGIVENIAVAKHLAQFFLKEVHCYFMWYRSKVICLYSMCG